MAVISSNSSTSTVINTYELIELILLQLPLKDLLLIQRVSKHFRHVLHRSLILKQNLHLEPDWTPTRTGLSQVRLEPTFARTYDAIGVIGTSFVYGELCMWMTKTTPPSSHTRPSQSTSVTESWRSMYPCQPPPQGVLWIRSRFEKVMLNLQGGGQRGFTFGMLVDVLWRMEEKWEEGKKARFYALSGEEVGMVMRRYQCEEVRIGEGDAVEVN